MLKLFLKFWFLKNIYLYPPQFKKIWVRSTIDPIQCKMSLHVHWSYGKVCSSHWLWRSVCLPATFHRWARAEFCGSVKALLPLIIQLQRKPVVSEGSHVRLTVQQLYSSLAALYKPTFLGICFQESKLWYLTKEALTLKSVTKTLYPAIALESDNDSEHNNYKHYLLVHFIMFILVLKKTISALR